MTTDSAARIDELEDRVDRLEAELLHQQAATRSAVQPPPPPPPGPHVEVRPPFPPPSRPVFAGPHRSLDSEALLKWGGISLVVLAVAFAVSTAISRGWIGPELQLLGALAVASALIYGGFRLRPTRPGWTHTLCSGGVAALLIIPASNLFVDLTGETTGLACLTVSAAIGFVVAYYARSEWVGAVAILGAPIAALVLEINDDSVYAFVAWGLVVTGAALGLALVRRWAGLALLGQLVAVLWILGASTLTDTTPETIAVLIGVGLVVVALHITPSLGDESDPFNQVLMRLAGLAAPWTLLCIAIASGLEEDSVWPVAFGVGIAGFALAFGGQSRLKAPHFIALLVGASATLSIGLATLLSAEPTALALGVQGLGLVVMARFMKSAGLLFLNGLVLLFISLIIGFGGIVDAWVNNSSVGVDVVHGGIVLCLIAAAALITDRTIRSIAACAGLVLLLLWIGSVLVHLPQGQAMVSIAWALVGVGVLLVGTMNRQPTIGYVGLAILGITVAKLLSVDLREVDTLWRAGLFMLIGLGFLRLGFLLPRLMAADEPRS
jgi:hypothetical protein